MKDSESKKSFFSRLFGSAMTALKSAMSNNELRMKLYRAIEQVDQGVMYVDDEDVEAKTFRYCVVIRYGDYWDYDQMEHHYYQRSFSIGDDGNVTIGDDRKEVEWFEGWREVTETVVDVPEMVASESESTCSCQEKEVSQVNVNEKKALVTRLIGAKRSPFEESDRTILEGMKDEKLTSLMSAYEGEATTTTQITTATTEPAPTATATTTVTAQPATQTIETQPQPAPDQVIISKEEYSDIKAAASAYRQQQEQYRTSLVTSLKGAQSAFTEEDLKGMTTQQLEKLATTLNVNEPATADYSVRGHVESRVASSPAMRELPDTWGLSKTN